MSLARVDKPPGTVENWGKPWSRGGVVPGASRRSSGTVGSRGETGRISTPVPGEFRSFPTASERPIHRLFGNAVKRAWGRVEWESKAVLCRRVDEGLFVRLGGRRDATPDSSAGPRRRANSGRFIAGRASAGRARQRWPSPQRERATAFASRPPLHIAVVFTLRIDPVAPGVPRAVAPSPGRWRRS